MLLIPLLSLSAKAQNLKVHKDNNQNIKTFLSALERNNIEQMDKLLSSGIVNANNTYIHDEYPVQNRPIITAAIEKQNFRAIELLIKYGANINMGFQVEKTKYNPFGGSWGIGGTESLGLITVYPINIAFDKYTYNKNIVDLLIKNNVNLERASEQIKELDLESIKHYSKFVKLNFNTVDLNNAITKRLIDKSYFLLSNGVKPNGISLENVIEYTDNFQLFDSLVYYGANINERSQHRRNAIFGWFMVDWAPMCAAVSRGNLKWIKKLVEEGGDLKCKCSTVDGTVKYDFNDAMSYASKYEKKEIVDYFVMVPVYLKEKEKTLITEAIRLLLGGNLQAGDIKLKNAHKIAKNNMIFNDYAASKIIETASKLTDIKTLDSSIVIYSLSKNYSKPKYYYAMGGLNYKQKKYAEAIPYYDSLIISSNDPTYKGLGLLSRSASLLSVGDHSKAFNDITALETMSKKTKSLKEYALLGSLAYYASTSNFSKADGVLKKILKTNPAIYFVFEKQVLQLTEKYMQTEGYKKLTLPHLVEKK